VDLVSAPVPAAGPGTAPPAAAWRAAPR